MIKVNVWENKKGEMTAFAVEGHAGAGEKGEDLVCAGVSAIAQTTLLGLQNYFPHGLKSEIRNGFLSCFLPEDLGPEEKLQAEAILKTFILGLLAMEKSYRKYLKIERRREDR